MAAENWDQVESLSSKGNSIGKVLGLEGNSKYDSSRLTVEGVGEKPLQFYFMSSDQCQTLHKKSELALKENYIIVPPFVDLTEVLNPQ